MHILLFEDDVTSEIRPLNLARPAFGVSMAATRLYDVAASFGPVSAIVRDYLRAKTEADYAIAPEPARDVLFVNASLVPSFAVMERLVARAGQGPFIIDDGDRVAAACVEGPVKGIKKATASRATAYLRAMGLPKVDEHAPLVSLPCDVVRYHMEFFNDNIARLTGGLSEVHPGVFAGENVAIHPTAVLDARHGPVILEDDVSVGPFALFIGPAIVGKGTKIIERASIKEQVQIGRTCKIGGEVEVSSIESFTNKQHHGFLGHSYIGSWVNMGAGTSGSDLKNTYGEISIIHRGKRAGAGMQFLGCIMGDFSKTAINTSIFTGKLIGVASYLYGFIGTNVPSFTNYARSFGQETECLLDSVIRTEQRMFARRNLQQTPVDVKLLEDLYEITRDERLMSTDQLTF